jgi:hypothetical protein
MIAGLLLVCVMHSNQCVHITLPQLYSSTQECRSSIQEIIRSGALRVLINTRVPQGSTYLLRDYMCVNWSQPRA